jgi:branched-chain amino acid transport system permease protein
MGFRRDLAACGGFLLLLLVLPHLLANDYYISVLILGCLAAMTAVGLNLLIGYAGQISLGHAAFVGLGAYVSGLLTTQAGWPVLPAVLCAVVVTAACAWLIGIPTLKLSGHYLAMATLGFGIIVSIVFNEAVELTGGPSGFVGIPRLELFGYAFDTDISYYRLLAVVLAAQMLIFQNIIRSRMGRALRAIHTAEAAARCMGVDVAGAKLFVFTLSAGAAGLSGALYAHYLEFVAPSSFGFLHSVQYIVMVVLGGMGNAWGAILGAFFLTALPEFLRAFEDVETILYGAILILSMMFLPEGLVGGLAKLWGRVRAKRSGEAGHG